MAPPTKPSDADYPPLLTVAQVQDYTQLGRGQVYRLIRDYLDSGGREGIPSVRFGHSLRVPLDGLRRMSALPDQEGATL